MKTRYLSLYLIALTALYVCNFAQADTLNITHAWIREAPPSSKVLAAYMSINNPGETAITVKGISSPDFESAEVHRTVINEGVARMLHVEQLEVPANGNVKLEPGGLHLMLFNPERTLAAGDTVSLTIYLDNDTCMTISTAVVRQVNDDQTHQHH